MIAAPGVRAAGNVCFTAINDTLVPLNDTTMPVILGSQLYIPCDFFTSDALGVYYIPGDSQVMLYSTSKKIIFYIEKSAVIGYDDNNQYYIPAEKRNGRIYVPIDEICVFFGLKYDVIQSQSLPAPVVRFYNGTAYSSRDKFIALNKYFIQTLYDAYVTAEPSATPESPAPPTYPDVSVYLSFYDLTGGNLKSILEKLASTSYKACFFVTSGEIEAHADLLRRAAGKGHTLGVLLTEGTKDGAYQEYEDASARLFEAAMVKTVIVSALGDGAKAAEEMAQERSLVFWRPTRSYDREAGLSVAGLTDQLSTLGGMRESLYFPCSDETAHVLRQLLNYLALYDYSVRRVTETSTSIPVMAA
jgi:hypothetical protein